MFNCNLVNRCCLSTSNEFKRLIYENCYSKKKQRRDVRGAGREIKAIKRKKENVISSKEFIDGHK
jgi:hypothetical protein